MEKNVIVSLSNDNRYFVIESINMGSGKYLYLINVDDLKDIKICSEKIINNQIVLDIIDDPIAFANLTFNFFELIKAEIN